MRLTKKHFEFLAAAFRKARATVSPAATEGVDAAVVTLADELQTTNPAFRRTQFLDACECYQSKFDFGDSAFPFSHSNKHPTTG